jgi:hypothetical protein
MLIRKDDDGLWKLWETRSVGFPRSGGRVLGVHGSGSFHGPSGSVGDIISREVAERLRHVDDVTRSP